MNQRGAAERWADRLLGPVVAVAWSSVYMPVNDMAKFAVEAIKGRWESRGRMFRNKEMRVASREERLGGER